MALTTGSMNKREKRAEKMAISERLTNGFMLTLTYGIIAIFLLEIAKRHYLRWDMEAWDFASNYGIVFGVIFAVLTAVVLFLGIFKKISWKTASGYTVFTVISSFISFFISYDMRLPLSRYLLVDKGGKFWSGFDFLANLDLARDVKMIEYGVVAYIAIAFVVYAIRLALVEKKK